jgi:hypothetical protein
LIEDIDEEIGLQESIKIYEAISPHFSGAHPAVVGFVISRLMATWLSGYVVVGGGEGELEGLHIRMMTNVINMAKDLLENGDEEETIQ